jgi:FKBP12-rapamycin complex-associated protein
MASLPEGVALQAALQSLDVYMKEVKNKNISDDQRKRAARQLRDLVATVKQGNIS